MEEEGNRHLPSMLSMEVESSLLYVKLDLDTNNKIVKAEKCLSLISNWLVTLRKEARRKKRAHLEDLSEIGGLHSQQWTRLQRALR